MSPTDLCESRCARGSAVPILLAVAAIAALILTSCSVPRASITASLTPSPTPQPMEVALTVEQQGSVEAHTLQLVATITVTNRSPETIGIANWPQNNPSYARFEIFTATYGTEMWNSMSYGGPCSFSCLLSAVATLAPMDSRTWTATFNLSKAGGFVPSLAYRVMATIHWYIGPTYNDSVKLNETSGQAQITLM